MCPQDAPIYIGNYLLGNLFRHLTESGRLAEAVGILCRMGWTKLRVVYGGISSLNADFSLVENAITGLQFDREEDWRTCFNAYTGTKTIWEMVKMAWPVILQHSEGLPTHAYGYLVDIENVLPLVKRYLESSRDIITGPWLKPRRAFWRMLRSSSNGRIFRAADLIVGIAMESSSKSIIVATRMTLFWIDIETMNATREMRISDGKRSSPGISAFCLCEMKGILVVGLDPGALELRNEQNGTILKAISTGYVDCVATSANGRIVASGFEDNTVQVWDIESRSAVYGPLCGHEDVVESVAISAGGRMVVSGSGDGTVRLWDVESGTAIGELLRGHNLYVYSVAISDDGRIVTSGSDDNIHHV